MKIKIVEKSYSEVMTLPTPKHRKPHKMGFFFKNLIKILAKINLKKYHISYHEHDMDKLKKGEPCLVLMNHSGFIDMQIAADYLYPRSFSTVCTTDAYIGLSWLLNQIGCIPTQKFVSDFSLIKDISYALHELKTTVLMYPEAIYSFDGTASTLPDTVGKLIKLLKVPVVTIITQGAYSREPLYNMLQHRKVDISADVTYLLSAEDAQSLSSIEINQKIQEVFSFDAFRWQRENGIRITEDFRADGLERVLYKCPHCLSEGKTKGAGVRLTCKNCNAEYELTELGAIEATNAQSAFTHIPDWFRWQRGEVQKEIADSAYSTDIDVDIYMMVDYKAFYHVGDGHLLHNEEGFHLTGCQGELDYYQSAIAAYTANSDYYFYEIGDVISIGNKRHIFYCFPKNQQTVVTKVKMAAEELYKIKQSEARRSKI